MPAAISGPSLFLPVSDKPFIKINPSIALLLPNIFFLVASIGGEQERSAVTRFIKEVVPDAQIEARRVDKVEIKVFVVEGSAERSIFTAAQREFFQKNGHRGKKPLQEALSELK